MDKGKSKTDLRAAGKKRLEEFRQKRQQKGSSTKPTTTTALKALTESEQSSGDHDGMLISELTPSGELQRVSSGNSGKAEGEFGFDSVIDDNAGEASKAHEEEGHGSNMSLDPSPASSVASPIIRVRLGGHVAPEALEQTDSPCDPGSSNGNPEDSQREREAVYTILWENHGTDHPQRNEAWQESTYDRGENLDERALDQGNYSTFRVDDEHYAGGGREESSTRKKLSGGLEDASESFRVAEDATARDENSPTTESTEQTPLQDAVADDGGRDCLPGQSDAEAQPSPKKEGGTHEERILSERDEALEREKAQLVAELHTLQQKLENVLEDSRRERELLVMEIGSLKAYVGECAVERDMAMSMRDSYLEELENAKSLEQNFRSAIEKADNEKQHFMIECENLKFQSGTMVEEKDQLLSKIDGFEKELETLRAESTRLVDEMKNMAEEKTQLAEDLRAAREQVQAATEREYLLLSELSGLKEEGGINISRLGDLQKQLQGLVEENLRLEVRCTEYVESLENLRVASQKLVDDVAELEQGRQARDVKIVTMEDEQLKFHALVENLTYRLQIYEEERKELEALDARVKLFEEENLRLTSLVESLSISLQAAGEEKEELASKLGDLQIENVGLMNEIRDAKNDIKVMEEEVQKSIASVRTLQEENSTMSTDKDELSLQVRNLEEEKVELASKVNTLSLLQQELQGEILRLGNEAEGLESERDSSAEEFAQKLESKSLHVQSLEQTNVSLVAKNDDLGQQLQSLGAEKAQLATKLADLEAERDDLCQKMEKADARKETLDCEKSALVSELATLSEQLQVLKEEKEKLKSLHEVSKELVQETFPVSFQSRALDSPDVEWDLPSALGMLQQHIRAMSEERDRLVSSLDAVREHLKELKTEKEQLQSKVVELGEHSRKVTEDGLDVARQLDFWKREAGRVQEEREEFAKQLMLVKIQLEAGTAEQSDIAMELQSLKTEISRLEGENRVTTLKEEEVRQELEQSKDGLNRLEQRLENENSFASKVEVLEQKVGILDGEKATVEKQLAEVREELEQLSEQLIRLNAEKTEIENVSASTTEALEQKVRILEGEVVELQGQVKSSKEECVQLNEKATRLDADKTDIEASFEVEVETLRQSLQILEDEKLELEKQVKELVEEKAGVTGQLVVSQQSLKKMTEEKMQVESELQSLQEGLQIANEERRQVESERQSLFQKLKEVVEEKDLVTNQLEVSQESPATVSEEKTRVESEFHALLERLKEWTEEKDTLSTDLQSTQQALQRVGEEKAHVEAELEGSLSRLNYILEEKNHSGSKLEALLESAQALDAAKLELTSRVEQLQESVKQKDEEVARFQTQSNRLQEEREQFGSENTAKVEELESKLARLHELANENCRLEAALKELERQVAEQQVQTNYQVLEEARSPTLERGCEEMVSVDSEEVSPTSHAANVRLVKKLVKVFEGRASEDVPDRHPRGATSPVTELFKQARAMKKTADVSQQERDAAIQAVIATRAELELCHKKLEDAGEERVTLQASIKDLDNNLATVTADYSSLKQVTENLRDAEEARVNLVTLLEQSEEGNNALKSQNHSLAEKLVIAAKSSDTMAEELKDLQKRFEELELICQTEKDASEKLMSRVGSLASFIEETLTANFPDFVYTCQSACDVVLQVEKGLGLLIKEVLPDLIAKVKALEEERDTAGVAVHDQLEKNETLQREKEAMIMDMEVLMAEIERKATNEAEARIEYERDIETLTSKLQEVESELHIIKDAHVGFEKKLELAVYQDLPDRVVKPPGVTDSSFEFCWALVSLMLERSAKKLEDVQAELAHARTELDEVLREEKAQHETSVGALEAEREALKQEKEELSTKVRLLWEERGMLQEEREHLAAELLTLQEEKLVDAKASVDLHREFDILNIKLDGAQREVEERNLLEAEARAEYERERESLESRLQEMQSEMEKFKDAHVVFEKQLEHAVSEKLPEGVVKPPGVVDSPFDFCWTMVSLILEESSRQLQHLHLLLVETQNNFKEKLREQEAQHVEALESCREVLMHEREEQAQRVATLVAQLKEANTNNSALRIEVDRLREEIDGGVVSKELAHDNLKKQIEDGKMGFTKKMEEIEVLQEQVQSMSAELAKAKEEKSVAQAELAQSEKRLANTKERLTLAINKGKSVVQQRDAVKASLAEKTRELEQVVSSHTEIIKLKDVALQEAEAKVSSLNTMAERASLLEADLAAAQNTADSLEKSFFETRSSLNELEAAVDRITALPDEWKSKNGVAKTEWVAGTLVNLQMRANYFESKAEDLISDLTTMSSEREAIVQKLRDVTVKCDELEKTSAEDASEKEALEAEITLLQETILALKAEASRHIKLQQDVRSAMKLLDSSREGSALRLSNSKSFTELGLEAAIALLVEEYSAAVHEVEELTQRTVLLREAAERSERERSSISDSMLQSLQETLQDRDMELTEVNKRLEEAATTRSQQDSDIAALMQETQRLRDELVNSNKDLMTSRADLSITEKKVTALREQLKLAMDFDCDSVPRDGDSQVEVTTQSVCEEVMELESLAVTIVERLHRRETELQDVHKKFMGMADASSGLELELDTAKKLHADLEQEIMEFKKVVEEARWLQGPSHTSSPAEWVTWLINALQEQQKKAERGSEEAESLKRTAEVLTLQVEGLQGKNESLSIELSYQEKESEAVAKELRIKDVELQAAQEKLQAMAEKASALELELGSAKNPENELVRAFSEFKAVVEQASLLEGPSPSSSPAEWFSWLLQALQQEQEKASQATQEVESLKRAADAVLLEVEGVQEKYETLCVELANQKGENATLGERLKELSEKHNALTEQAIEDATEKDALKAQIQALESSHLELARRDIEFSEASTAVKSLQETVAFREEELNELRKNMEDASLESAQHESEFQALLEERQRLSDKLAEVEGERDNLRVEATKAVQERSGLQSEVSQAEQKLVVAREKLNMAIKKGKGLEKQRDSLKQSLAEQTAKMENMVLAHQALQSKEAEQQEVRIQLGAMASQVHDLEAELASVREKATASEQWVDRQFRRLESALSQIELPKDAVPEGPVEKIEWLVVLLKETRNTVVLLEREVENGRDAVEALKSALRDAEERAQSLVIENASAQETISLWVKKAEEAENRAVSDRAQYENEIDAQAQALKEAELRLRAFPRQMEEMEQLLQKNQNALNAAESARSKVVSKLAYTRNKLNELVQQSQDLVRECEALHKNLQDRNAEIVELKEEIARLTSEPHLERNQVTSVGSEAATQIAILEEELARVTEKAEADVRELSEKHAALQSALQEKNSELSQLQTQLEGMLAKGDSTVWMERNIVNANQVDDRFEDIDLRSTNGGGYWVATISALEQRLDKHMVEAQAWRVSTEKKDAQLQKLRKEVDELSTEKALLQAGLQAKQSQIERLQTEITAAVVPVGDTLPTQSEIEEVGPRSSWVGPGSSAAPHVRGARKPAQSEITIDMDEDTDQLLSDLDDKGHGFSALTNSRIVPKATRVLADRLDGLCVAGGRLLMRQPSARLGLAMYWIMIHVYMAMIFSRAIVL